MIREDDTMGNNVPNFWQNAHMKTPKHDTGERPPIFADSLPDSYIKSLSIRVDALGGINLGQGIPSFPTAPHILKAAKDALDEPAIGVYPDFLGNADLRHAIAGKLHRDHNITLSAEREILVTVGAMEATAAIIFSLVGDGDTVGVVTPDYTNHFPQIQLARGKVREIPMKNDGEWALDLEEIEKAAKEGMKLLIITNPNNPTGAVFGKEHIDTIVHLAEVHGFWILSDETYHFLTYGSASPSLLLWWGTGNERLLTVRSFSKEYAMTGWRVGYVVAHASVRDAIAKTHDALVGTAPRISQRAASAAIAGPQTIVREYASILKSRRDLLCEKLDAMSEHLSYHTPAGTYYLMARYKRDVPSLALSEEILKKTLVAVVPGSIFGTGGEGHFRISFGVTDDVLMEGMKRIGAYFAG